MKRTRFEEGHYFNFILKLVEIREQERYRLEDVASDCLVTVQTVRNFENAETINPIVLLWYLRLYGEATSPEQAQYMINYVFGGR